MISKRDFSTRYRKTQDKSLVFSYNSVKQLLESSLEKLICIGIFSRISLVKKLANYLANQIFSSKLQLRK